MPGSVANAAPVDVLPQILAKTLVSERAYPLLANDYPDGSSQRSLQASTSRKAFTARLRKTASLLVTWRTFYDDHNGPLEPFYVYYAFETSPKFFHDPTGVATTGRYTMRFDGTWEQFMDLARGEFEIRLMELA